MHLKASLRHEDRDYNFGKAHEDLCDGNPISVPPSKRQNNCQTKKSAKMSEMKKKSNTDINNIENTVNGAINHFADMGLWTGALFWADKAMAISGSLEDSKTSDPELEMAMYKVARCMSQKGEHLRAVHLLTENGLHMRHLLCHFATTSALLQAGDYAKTVKILELVNPENLSHTVNDPPKHRVLSAISVIKGKALGALERRAGAESSFLNALHQDVFCYEALDYITRHHMLTPKQEIELLENLPFESQCTPSEAAFLKLIYRKCLNCPSTEEKESKSLSLSTIETMVSRNDETRLERLLENSTTFIECKARNLLRNSEFKKCVQVLGSLESLSERLAEMRTACLVELKYVAALFALAHYLVDRYPQSATSWFAVGCYYYTIGKSEFARRYLSKATTLDRGMGAAWLAYGHSFAADNEHDQAMAAYFKASQLLNGCHLPLLYIGVECGLTNNAKMADKFFKQAMILAPDDPHVTHEMGVIAFQSHEYQKAEKFWKMALEEVESHAFRGMLAKRWQPLLNNLGHVSRKLGKHDEAIRYHERALTVIPGCGATHSALGLCYSLMGQFQKAMDCFHSSLSKKPDDNFATTMLTYLVEQLSEDGGNAQQRQLDDTIPTFPFPGTLSIQNLTFAPKKTTIDEDKSRSNLMSSSDMSMSFDE